MTLKLYNSSKSFAILSFLILCITVFSANGQSKNGSITGTVKTSDGSPAAAVSVSLKEVNRGSITNDAGLFTIKGVKEGSYTLLISYVGLEPQSKTVLVTAGQSSVVDFTLIETSGKLAEVVVTGTKSVNKKPVSVGKIDITPMDLPQSVAVINSTVIAEQQVNKLSDAIKNVNGVSLGTTRGTTSETFFARGYNLGANNIMKNGARSNSGVIPEASALESIEVLKGSSALLYGNVTAGAVINMVTKQPKFNFGGEVSMRTGSYDFYKPTLDVYGPISKKVAFRVIGTYENSKSFRHSVESKRIYVNPSILYKISDKTDLLVQGDYLDADLTPDFGLGSLADTALATSIDRSSFFNTPWAYNKAKQATANATLNHQFNEKWKLNAQVAYQNFDRNYFSTERIQAKSNGDWARNLTRTKTNENYYTTQLNLNGSVKTGKVEHKLLLGADAEKYMNNTYGFKKFPTAYDQINILDPSKYSWRTDMPSTSDSIRNAIPTNRFGIFVQDLISISEKIKVLAGLRWSYIDSPVPTIYNLTNGTDAKNTTIKYKSDKAFSPRLGVVYQPSKNTSVFASYSNNFVPNTSGTDIYQGSLDPSTIDQYEVGIKNDFLQGRLSVNLTAYKIINNNLVQTARYDKEGKENFDTNLKEFSGQTTSDGIELDINGTITKGLNFLAGYSYTYMRYTKTPDTKGSYVEGERLVSVPSHTANGTVFYTFSNSTLKGLKVGVSGFYTGERNAGWNNTKGQTQKNRLIPVSGFTTFDLSLGYTFKKFSVLGKVSNITDELNYYVHENYSVNPIAPRQFMATVAYKF